MRRAGEVEAAQLAGALVAVAGEGGVDEQAQLIADTPQLVREVEDPRAALSVALVVHTLGDLVTQALQQALEFLGQQLGVGAVLALAEGNAEYLLVLFARLLVEEGVEALQAVGLAQHQVHRHLDMQAQAQLLQA